MFTGYPDVLPEDGDDGRHAEHDHRGKLILEQAADYLGDTHREEEVPSPDGQRIDLWFIRRLIQGALPRFMQLLDKMLQFDAMVDIFSQTLTTSEFLRSHRKQMNWHAHLEEQAERRLAVEKPGSRQQRPLVAVPMLWLTSHGYPERVIKWYAFTESTLGPGLYTSHAVFPMGIVVISALPRSRETLLLRLMGDRAARAQATQDLLEIPASDPEKWPLLRLLGSLLRAMNRGRKPGSSATKEEEPMSELWAEMERHEQSLLDRGMEQGVGKGQAQAILKFLAARHLPVSDAVRERILTTTETELLDRWIVRAVTATSAEEVIADA